MLGIPSGQYIPESKTTYVSQLRKIKALSNFDKRVFFSQYVNGIHPKGESTHATPFTASGSPAGL